MTVDRDEDRKKLPEDFSGLANRIEELETILNELEDHVVHVHKCMRFSLVERVHARSKTNEGAIPK